jgi:uncharacterized protein YegP (UPF0339 family)
MGKLRGIACLCCEICYKPARSLAELEKADIENGVLCANCKAKRNPMKFEVYKDRANEWRWRLVAKNGEPIADSGEGYKRKVDCVDAIGLVSSVTITDTESEFHARIEIEERAHS